MHRPTGPAPSIVVWGGIGFYCRTPLIELLLWPASSPDILPIENVWSTLAQRLARDIPTAAIPDQFGSPMACDTPKDTPKASLILCRGVWQRLQLTMPATLIIDFVIIHTSQEVAFDLCTTCYLPNKFRYDICGPSLCCILSG
ncbi:hypothetical protein TNCV_1401591 [Trichonephila clavipes]|nr:hypothetical protein TNCV_1401591 [Trichonephila clavipes]